MASLIGGQPFVLPCKIGHNGIILTTNALIDTGANGYIFINTELAAKLAKRLDIPIQTTPDTCGAEGYDGQQAQEINQLIQLSLGLDNRRFFQQPFILVHMKHDVIIGRKFFAKHQALVDCSNRQLIWRDGKDREYTGQREIRIPRWTLREQFLMDSPQYQEDIHRRDKKWPQRTRRCPLDSLAVLGF